MLPADEVWVPDERRRLRPRDSSSGMSRTWGCVGERSVVGVVTVDIVVVPQDCPRMSSHKAGLMEQLPVLVLE